MTARLSGDDTLSGMRSGMRRENKPQHCLISAMAVFAAMVMLVSCSVRNEESPTQTSDDTPDIVFFGYSREEVNNGVVTFKASAEKAEYFQEQRKLVIYNVRFEDRGESGQTMLSEGEAEKAIYYEDTGNAEFSGFISIRSYEEDASFETSALRYDAATQTLEGDAKTTAVVQVGTKLFLHGMGFFADIQNKAFSFRNGVSGSILNKGSKP